jgi:hypothetical protein
MPTLLQLLLLIFSAITATGATQTTGALQQYTCILLAASTQQR